MESKSSRKSRPRWKRVLLILGAAAALIALAAVVFVHTRFFQNMILGYAQRYLRQNYGLMLTVKNIHIDPFALAVSLDGVEIKPVPPAEPFLRSFSADRIFVDIPLSAVTSGKMRLQRLIVHRPRLDVEQPRPGDPLIAALTKNQTGGGDRSFSLRLEAVDLDGGSIEYQNRISPLQLSLAGLMVSIRYLESEKDHRGLLKIEDGRADFFQSRLDLSGAEVQVRFNDDRIEIEKLLLLASSSVLEMTGKILNYRIHPEFRLEAKASTRLEDLPLGLKSPVETKGLVEVSASLRGSGEQPVIDGKIEGDDLAIAGIPVSFRAAFKGNRDNIEFSETVLKAAGGTLEAEGNLSLVPEKESSVRLRWEGVSLADLASAFPNGLKSVSSEISGRLEARWRKPVFEAIQAEGNVLLTPLGPAGSITATPVPALSGQADFRIREGTVFFSGNALPIEDTALQFSGQMDRDRRLEARFTLNIANLGKTARAARRQAQDLNLLDRIPDMERMDPSKLQGSAQLTGKVLGTLDDPLAALDLEIRNLTYDRITIPEISISLKGGRRGAELTRFQANFNGGRLEGSGYVALDPGSALALKDGGLSLQFSNIDIGPFAAWLPDKFRKPMTGRLSGEIGAKGGLSDPIADFQIGLTDGSFGDIRLPRLKMNGHLESGRLTLNEFRADLAAGFVSGNLSLDVKAGRLMACEIIGEKIDLSGFASLAPQSGPLEGILDLKLRASGTPTSPEYALDIQGEGIRYANFRLSTIGLRSGADGRTATATLSVPALNARIEAELRFERPYVVDGKIKIADLKLSRLLATGPPPATETGEKQLNIVGAFRVPLEKLSDASAEITFSGVDFRALASLFLAPSGQPIEAGGEAAGKIRFKGNPMDAGSFDIAGEIGKLALSLSGLAFENKGPIKFLFRDGRIALENCFIAGEKGEVRISGGASFPPGAPELDFKISAATDLSILGSIIKGMAIGGSVRLDVSIAGTPQNPQLKGTAELEDGYARLRDYPILVSGAQGRIEFKNTQAIFSSFKGTANGGAFDVRGSVDFGRLFKPERAKFSFRLDNFGLNYPPGLSTLSSTNLTVEGDGKSWLISGKVDLAQVFYREDILPGVALVSMVGSRLPGGRPDLPPQLNDIALNITVSTAEPAILKNNLADLALRGALKISGTAAAPVISGRIQNAYVGEIVFGERRYTVETVRIDFLGREGVDPNIEVLAHTKLVHKFDELDIELHITGSATNLKYTLTSVPPRPQEELSLLVLTGKSLDEFRGSAIGELGGQLVQYFADSLASPLTQSLKKFLKAEVVSVEPLNIASETDPGARFTFKKRISNQAALTYSIDVGNSQRQMWLLNYSLGLSLSLMGFRRDDATYGASLRHSFSLGGGSILPSKKATHPAGGGSRILTKISMTGDLKFPATTLEKMAHTLRPGSSFSYADVSAFLETGLAFYKDQGYMNAKITPRISEDPGIGASIDFQISAGRPSAMRYSGDSIPSVLKKKIGSFWNGRINEEVNLTDARDLILRDLRRKRYYAAEVIAEIKPGPESITYAITVRKGGLWRIREFSVEGNEVLPSDRIRKAIESFPGAEAGGLWNLIFDRRAALNAVRNLYEEHGYLKTSIGPPRILEDRDKGFLDIILAVKEGPPSRVHAVEIRGRSVYPPDELEQRLRLRQGMAYHPALLIEDKNALLGLYKKGGYQDVDIKPRIVPVPGSEDVDVIYEITEGPKHTVAALEFSGARRTRESYLRAEADLKNGAVLSLENLAWSQKKLYDTGAFRSVIIDSRPLEDGQGREQVTVTVQEAPFAAVNYGLRYNSEIKLEGFGEIDLTNLFGAGNNGLFSYRQNKRQIDIRFSMKQPYLFGFKLNSLLSLYYKKDIRESFETEEKGVSFQQQLGLPLDFTLSWVYKLNRIHEFELVSSGPFPFDFSLLLSDLSLYLVRDTRDDKLDAQTGSYFSANLTYSPKFIGSELTYISFFGQYSLYKALRPGWVLASNVRLGLASAFDQVLIPSRRFYAGGGNSIRGFKQDRVGPIDPFLDRPSGGNVLMVINQELRFPLYKQFKGTLFFDAGNVFETLGGARLRDFRSCLGLGLRFESPVGLVRLDYGFNLRPLASEPRGVFFLSVGQAF